MTKKWNTWSNISLQSLPVHFRTQVLSDCFSVNLCMCTVECVCMHVNVYVCVVLEVFFWSDRGRIRDLVEKSSICISNVTRSSRHLLKARGESTQIKGLTLRESPDHPALDALRRPLSPALGPNAPHTMFSVHHPHMQHCQRLIQVFFPLYL